MILLGKFSALWTKRQRQMNVIWHFPAKKLVQRDLPYCWFNQISPTHYFCNALEMIINHNSQVVGEQPITAMNDKIFPCQFFVGVNNAAQLVSKLRDRMLLADTHCGIVWSMMQHPAMTVVNTANALNTRTRTGAVIT